MRLRAGFGQTALAERIGTKQSVISAYETGERAISDAAWRAIYTATAPRPSEVLADAVEAIRQICAEHQAVPIGVFGSTARGEDVPGSDLDLVVRFASGATLIELNGLTGALEEALLVPVDVVSYGALEPGDPILDELRPLSTGPDAPDT